MMQLHTIWRNERVQMDLFVWRSSYDIMDGNAHEEGEASFAAYAQAEPRYFIQDLLAETPDAIVAPVKGTDIMASSHELGLELAQEWAGREVIDPDIHPIDFRCFVLPDTFEWPPPASLYEDQKNLARARSIGDIVFTLTLEPSNLA